MSGPKPVPTVLKLLRGNTGHRPINIDEFRPATAIPRPPAHVRANSEANREWKRITILLAAHGVMSEVDRAAIAFYCITWARHVEAEEMIEKASLNNGTGLFVKTPNGFAVQSPWLAVSNRAMEMCAKFLIEFGMTPSARSRVSPSALQGDLFQDKTQANGWNAL